MRRKVVFFILARARGRPAGWWLPARRAERRRLRTTRSCSPARPIRCCSTRRSCPTASRSGSRTRSSRASSASSWAARRSCPQLATSWKPSKNALSWTFKLRTGVKFSDGTPFNAAAVCYNYDRWYNFPAALQNPAVSYYWNTVFGGFAHPAKGNPGPDKSLYKSCKTNGDYEVTLNLTRRSSSFISAIGSAELRHRQPDGAEEVQGRRGHGRLDRRLPSRPVRSQRRTRSARGPYMLQSWEPGSSS